VERCVGGVTGSWRFVAHGIGIFRKSRVQGIWDRAVDQESILESVLIDLNRLWIPKWG